ncbi:hypothetical protein JOB18_018218 [Solea senegalensis]|uniref:Secreted protein n=1 Tax=Solea senegalensis TaxID=28829 RepID=A0AAV6S5X9_SOLSE|nr:hypothetical protein JOB18_018218 [Solea senegalensis]
MRLGAAAMASVVAGAPLWSVPRGVNQRPERSPDVFHQVPRISNTGHSLCFPVTHTAVVTLLGTSYKTKTHPGLSAPWLLSVFSLSCTRPLECHKLILCAAHQQDPSKKHFWISPLFTQ